MDTNQALPAEVFFKCPSFPGYLASNSGRVQVAATGSIMQDRQGHGTVLIKSTSPTRDQYGNASGRRYVAISRLVADAFHGPCPPKHTVRHLDGNHDNNATANLAYSPKTKRHAFTSQLNRHPPVAYRTIPVATRLKMSAAKLGPRHVRAIAPPTTIITAMRAIPLTDGQIAQWLHLKRTVVGDVLRGTHWSVRTRYTPRNGPIGPPV